MTSILLETMLKVNKQTGWPSLTDTAVTGGLCITKMLIAHWSLVRSNSACLKIQRKKVQVGHVDANAI